MRQQIFTFQVTLIAFFAVNHLNGHSFPRDTDTAGDMIYFENFLVNSVPGLDPNITCETDEPCLDNNAVCGMMKCICPPYFEWDVIGKCNECPLENHYCGYNGCCGSNTLLCYYGVCKPCVREPGSSKCITREQMMYSTLSQISLALAMVLGILALITLLYKTCKKPNTLFGHSERLTGSRHPISVIDNERHASITSTQRRVLNQMRDRPPRYEREQSVHGPAPSRDTPNVSTHALGEPPPLYSEMTDTQSDTRQQVIEPPPAYSAAFPTISMVTFTSELNVTLTEEDKDKDEVASGSATCTEDLKEEKRPVISSDPESSVGRTVER